MKETYLRAIVQFSDVWGFEADVEAARKQIIKLLDDRLDCNVLSVKVTLISKEEWEKDCEAQIEEEGEYATQDTQ